MNFKNIFLVILESPDAINLIMRNVYSLKIGFKKIVLLKILFIVSFFSFEKLLAQNYRIEYAYINDFGKNEVYIKESIIEYSQSIIDNNSLDRTQAKLNTTLKKLININFILEQNDKGIDGDTSLRDAFMKLNSKTIELLNSKILVLTDYQEQSELSCSEIVNTFSLKEIELKNYYNELANYENVKKEFGTKHRVIIRSASEKEVLEYNAFQNFTFYKMNVIDEKLIQLISSNNLEESTICMDFLLQTGQEELQKIEAFSTQFNDNSLGAANKQFIELLQIQKDELIPLFTEFIKIQSDFTATKKQFENNDAGISVEIYNQKVRDYNNIKNAFYDKLNALQDEKSTLITNWHITNSNFLNRNLKFENIYDKYFEAPSRQTKKLNTAAKKY